MQHAANGITINIDFELNGEFHRSAFWTSNPVVVKGAEHLIAKMLKELHEERHAEVLKVCKVEAIEHELIS